MFLLGVLVLASAGLLVFLLSRSGPLPQAQAGPDVIPIREPEPMDARLAVLNALGRYPLVALSEVHGLKEEATFIDSLILDPGNHELWLDPDVQDATRLEPLLVPYTSESMAAYPVSTIVNNADADDPRCVEPAA
jgi:hypothetical protein